VNTPEIIFLGLIAAILLIGFAWTFAPGNNRFMPFWIERTGRRASATGPVQPDSHGDQPEAGPDASHR
jgi:hypothetical protein